ncbi:response regulator [Desulfococcaceae bacterium HSG7]|nr:response regulator [Desulfococcaceae bacterium HSG7]
MVQIVAMDDSNFQRKMLTKIVKEEGHEVIEAANGHEGLFKIATYRPDLVLMDLVMPNVTGIDVLEVLHHKNFEVPVIVISADIQAMTKERCKRLGAVAFINKPIKKDEVTKTLREVIASLKENTK